MIIKEVTCAYKRIKSLVLIYYSQFSKYNILILLFLLLLPEQKSQYTSKPNSRTLYTQLFSFSSAIWVHTARNRSQYIGCLSFSFT